MKKRGNVPCTCLILSVFALLFACSWAAEPDLSAYISIDEVRPDMEAYCLTVFSGMEIERFPLKVLSVVRGVEPGQDMILVIGTDERFQHAGTVHGCSGSPVYIDGRLAGALAAGWDGSLDSLYLVRPIKDMLNVGSVETAQNTGAGMVLHYNLSGPLDLADIYRQATEQMQSWDPGQRMLLPLVSSLPPQVCESLSEPLGHLGFLPVSGLAAMPTAQDAGQLERGGVLAIPLCSGDISLAATGTVTEVIGDQVYGFGHNFTGSGPVSFPMSAGIVHSVVAGRSRSFKLATPGPVLGTLEFDQSSAVRGTVGKTPALIPLTIRVERFNDPVTKTYHCQIVNDRVYTPLIAQVVVNGAALMQGSLPAEHTIRYQGQICVKDRGIIAINNISSGRRTAEVEQDVFSITSLLLNNPFEPMDIESIDLTMAMTPVSTLADVWSIDVSNTRVKPGETVSASIVLKSFRSEELRTEIDFQVPTDLPEGTYKLQILGDSNYQRFMVTMAPQRFRALDADTLMAGLQRVAAFRNDRLHAVMAVPASGVVLGKHELGQLPQTKMLLMQDAKRMQSVEAYKAWAENELVLDKIVQGAAEIELTVEQ